jgi:ElaB/YqjD/DUF883 family membrane-anchored ribosome-binding protein
MSNPNSDFDALRKDSKDAADTARQGAQQAAGEASSHARRAAADMAETAELTYEQLKEHAERLKADLASLTASARAAGYETAQEALQSARRIAEDGYEYAGDQLNEVKYRTEEFTREKPMTALGIAAAVGFVMAHLLSSRRD